MGTGKSDSSEVMGEIEDKKKYMFPLRKMNKKHLNKVAEFGSEKLDDADKTAKRVFSSRHKALILYLDSSFHGKFVNTTIRNGVFSYKDNAHLIDTAMPIHLKDGRAFYIFKWNEVEASSNVNKAGSKSRLLRIHPEFVDIIKMTPNLFKKLLDLKILENMIPAKKGFPNWMMLIAGLLIGVVLVYVMLAFNVIPR